MVTALLIIIYIAFIGLGLPHSLFGAAWPAIQADFALSIDSANYVTILISGFTVIASMLGARLVNRFGTRIFPEAVYTKQNSSCRKVKEKYVLILAMFTALANYL